MNTQQRFVFLDDRNYVHGTDIYDNMISAATKSANLINPESIGRLTFTLRRILRHQAVLAEGLVQGAVATLTTQLTGQAMHISLVETDEPITERRPSKEADTSDMAELTGQTISLAGFSPASSVSTAVFLMKQIVNSLHPLKNKAWFFSRLVLDRPFTQADRIDMCVKLSLVQHSRLAKASLVSARGSLGNIIFSVVDA